VRRRAVREYSNEPVLDDTILEIIKAAQFAPTGMNKREIEFVIVKKQEVKDRLYAILAQDFIAKAPVLIVPVCSIKNAILPETDLAICATLT
jgi:FMN reductase [NAD(P)H]